MPQHEPNEEKIDYGFMDRLRRWHCNTTDIRGLSDDEIAKKAILIGGSVESHKKWFYSFEIGEPRSTEWEDFELLMILWPMGSFRGFSSEDLKRVGQVGLYTLPTSPIGRLQPMPKAI